ncbi:MAG: nucleotidyltransferase domain-containing protein [Nanoarchaeota archaeon]|nr:nucleotidyltransferase domain-containing protein [Nanoarchaeota archaeon]MCG2717679.1 nucleotidyltransferase domain-containing protein [Nanoarchaeota archaeon]
MVRKFTLINVIRVYLNDYGKRFYLRELADLLNKPHQTIKPYVEELVKEGVLVKSERRNIVEYNLNFKDKRVYDYLVTAEKEALLERLRKDTYLKILFEKLSVFFEKNTFVIFGSAGDRLQKGSDIDLLVIGTKNVTKALEDYEDIYNKKIHKIEVRDKNKLTMTLVKEIYKKHLILNNTEEIIRFFGGLYEKNKLV